MTGQWTRNSLECNPQSLPRGRAVEPQFIHLGDGGRAVLCLSLLGGLHGVTPTRKAQDSTLPTAGVPSVLAAKVN